MTTETKTKTERQVMKKQHSLMVSWGRAMYLLAGFMALGQVVHAQEGTGITIKDATGGVIAGVPGQAVMMVLNGQNIGSSLLKVCDTNQDGVAIATEVKAALLNWFQQTDADANSAISEVELATALKSLFPPPQPPPGAPPPEDHALHYVLAKSLVPAVDANNDMWITSAEALAFVDRNFSKWDANGSGWLDASEFAAAFAQSMPAPSFNPSIEPRRGGVFTLSFPHAL
jgi:hypothetical protein